MGFFLDAQGQLTPQSLVESGQNSKLIRDIMVVLLTCKYEENPIKNEGARVLTRLYIDFSDAQWAGYSAVVGLDSKLKFEPHPTLL